MASRNGLYSDEEPLEVTLLNVRVAPGARKPGIVGRHADGIKVRVLAAPEAGRANQELIELMARTLDLPKTAIAIVRGHASRHKVVDVAGLSIEEILIGLGL